MKELLKRFRNILIKKIAILRKYRRLEDLIEPELLEEKEIKEAEQAVHELIQGASLKSREYSTVEVGCTLYFPKIDQEVLFIIRREDGKVIGCDSEVFSREDLDMMTRRYSDLLLGGEGLVEFYRKTGCLK